MHGSRDVRGLSVLGRTVRTGLAQRVRFSWLEWRQRNRIHNACSVGRGVELVGSTLEAGSFVADHADVRHTTLGAGSSIGRFAKVTHCRIGRFTKVSANVSLNATMHPIDRLTTNGFPYGPSAGAFVQSIEEMKHELGIGNDVWIGPNAVVLPGCTVGDGAIIGAGAVVTHAVPPYAVVAGVPARVERLRFSAAMIERLLRVAWWDLDAGLLQANRQLFQSPFDDAILAALEQLKAGVLPHFGSSDCGPVP